MGNVASLFLPRHYVLIGYQRSLERIDKDLKASQAAYSRIIKYKQGAELILLLTTVLAAAACAVFVVQLKVGSQSLGYWEHITYVATTVMVPLGLLLARAAIGFTLHMFARIWWYRILRLRKQRAAFLKQLKDAVNYEKLLGIIEKYGDANDKMVVTDTPANLESYSTTPHSRPSPHSTGRSMYQILQSTGEALSPVLNRLADMIEDDPTEAEAFRQLLQERDYLRHEVLRLRKLLDTGQDESEQVHDEQQT